MKKIQDIKVNKNDNNNFIKDVQNATVEKGVENAYWKIISNTFGQEPNDTDDTDGYIDIKYINSTLFMLMEFKYNRELEKRGNAVEVIIQALFYIKKFSEKMARIPNILMIGDQYHVFVINTKCLVPYLNRNNVDWNTSPSSAYKVYRKTLLIDLFNDQNITYYNHKIDKNFTFESIVKDIVLLISDSEQKIKLTPQNINVAFDRFINDVITNQKSFSAEQLVSIFIAVTIDRNKRVFSSSNGSTLLIDGEKVKINKANYQAFINHFEENYKPSEKRKFTAISDRLIQDVERRNNGEYYTPSAFVRYAYERLSKYLGSDWKNEFVIWDPAWGTGNLTRDENFANLYASTLNKSDLDQGNQYNNGASKFVFNFLNDDTDFEEESLFGYKSEKMPQKLVNILSENPTQKFLFFLNPPYATAGNSNSKSHKSKKNISNSKMQEEMKLMNLKVQEQLYAQFLYRIMKIKRKLDLKNVYIGLFSPSLMLTGSKYDKFRHEFLNSFEFLDGSIFQASNFADVKSNWAIDFTIWHGKKEVQLKFSDSKDKKDSYWDTPSSFEHNVLGLNDLGSVHSVSKKELWNTDGANVRSLQEYLKENKAEPSKITKDVIQFKSRYTTAGKEIPIPSNAVGYLINDTNNVEATAKGVYLMSSPITRHIKTSLITEKNFAPCMLVLASRKSILPTWFNQKDEFLYPNIEMVSYKKLLNKSVIYSIFSPSNNVISYRNGFDGMNIQNLNPWFFMSPMDIRNLADEFSNEEIYNDSISNSNEPLAYRYINKHKDELDSDDISIIKMAVQLIKSSFKFRNMFNEDNPDLFINTWDASWNQVSKLLNEYENEEYKKFNDKISSYLANIHELVIECGIMK